MKNIKLWKISLALLVITLLIIIFIFIIQNNNKIGTSNPQINNDSTEVLPLNPDNNLSEDNQISDNDSQQSNDNLGSSSANKPEEPSSSKSSSVKPNQGKTIILEDRSNGAYCAQAIEVFYEDNQYQYYFNCVKSNSMYVIINSKEYKLVYALKNNLVTINELEDAGYKFMKKSKGNQTK